MSSFTQAVMTATPVKNDRGRRLYISVGGFDYEIGYLGSGLKVHVPDGFLTDGPSVPHWLKRLFGWAIDIQSMMKSSAVHDRLREDLRFSKLETDAIFLAAMEAEGTPLLQREIAFLLVRFNRSRPQPTTI